MNLETHIKNDLWLAIQSTYDAGNYSHAILDAMHYLSNLIREKTGADGDGAALVGQAFGGDPPRLRLNKFQTETERGTQRGFESMLRGLYQAIRNPRSHEQSQDDQETANAIIYFIDYLIGIIDKSEEPFITSKFMGRVFDPEFYQSQHYAELLVNEIPTNKRFDVLVTIYRDKLNGDIYNVGHIIRVIIDKLTDEQSKQFLAIISEELSTTTAEKEFRYNFHILPPHLWEQIQEASKLRAENRVIKAIKEGEAIGDVCQKGALATWARAHFRHFKLKEQIGIAFTEKLEKNNFSDKFYVVKLFFLQLPEVVISSYLIQKCVNAISESIKNGDDAIRCELLDKINSLPENWQKKFAEALKDMTDENNPAIYLSTGVPFLTNSETNSGLFDEEIPF